MSCIPERMQFTDLVVILRPTSKVQKSDYLPNGLLPVIDQGAGLIGGYTNDAGTRFPSVDPVIVFGDHTCRFKYVPFPFAAGADGTQVFRGKDGIDTRYLYFACQSLGLEHFGYQRHMKHLKVAEVPVWPLPTQQRIAAILSAYDDLIESNTRRIAIIEEMARRLYEEWFVHFRFPGHGEVEFEEGEAGVVPAGWPIVRLEEIVLVNPRTTVPREGFKPFVPMGSLSETNMTIGPIEERDGNSGTKFQNGDTLVARITPCLENGKTGFVNFLDEERPVAFGSTEFIVLRPLILAQHAIYCLARSHAFRDVAIKSMSGSEGRQRVRPESVKSFPIAKPPAVLLDRFEQIAQPMFAQVSALARTNANLRAQRDLLLPKLVSGEIDVSEAEEAIEAAE
ncbi:restriction endonuclease subunit S [Amylibacter sp. IMCC11727]|uniref:restriction endonuclease subunit S n=1 Tax=Amylibacter sp. IMCC11727 TaxID=3039851 RepID=UPI00244DFA36|nr:restriction endonuclease subunit S [Amylibacter sp. IMCC11727]WGI21213.1 restriction endonuclease subunit S [Amylibacter sp. IMCC11727]